MKLAFSIPGPGGPITVDGVLPPGVPKGGFTKLNEIISVLIEFALVAAVFFALYVIAHSAYNMITSGGQKEQFAKAGERLRYAIIGLLVIFFAIFIINIIEAFLGAKLLGPNQ